MKNTKQSNPRRQNGLFRGILKAVSVMALACGVQAAEPQRPNIIYILADDWGLGDVKTYGGDRCKIDTPHMDQLAAKGMKFTDAHSSSSVCTPSRYSVITGRYNFRVARMSGLVSVYGAAKIKPGRETVASMLKKNGYATGMVGKWHLGMNLPTTDGKKPRGEVDKKKGTVDTNIDWNGTITGGPYDVGFDYSWSMCASPESPPYVWIENNRFTEPGSKPNTIGRPGPQGATFEADQVLPINTKKSVEYIEKQAKSDKPFFLYLALNSPHTPLVPSEQFKGKSELGLHADFVMETDWAVGEVVKAVEQAGIADNTLIIVTADNGCSPAAKRGFTDKTKVQFRMDQPIEEHPDVHYPSDIYRGHKADIYEGGHRVPYIARWDGKVKAGSVCDEPISLVDLYATCADIVGAKIPDNAAEDSVSTLPILLGTATGPIHEAVVHHSMNGYFAVRKGKWKLIFGPDSGGWSNPIPYTGVKEIREKKQKKGRICVEPNALADHEWVQLFDLDSDPAELKNLSGKYPEVVKTLTEIGQRYIDDGRSTPGAKQKNDVKTSLTPNWVDKYKNPKTKGKRKK